MPIRRCSGSTHGRSRRPSGRRSARARVGALEARDHPQQRRLARAARPEHGDELALLQRRLDARRPRAGSPNARLEHGCDRASAADR
jgi:hypothetical protein